MIDVTEVPEDHINTTYPGHCQRGRGCEPERVVSIKIDAYKVIKYNVLIKNKIDVFLINNLIDTYDVQPSYLKFDDLLSIYNRHNTNGDKINIGPGDVQSFK